MLNQWGCWNCTFSIKSIKFIAKKQPFIKHYMASLFGCDDIRSKAISNISNDFCKLRHSDSQIIFPLSSFLSMNRMRWKLLWLNISSSLKGCLSIPWVLMDLPSLLYWVVAINEKNKNLNNFQLFIVIIYLLNNLMTMLNEVVKSTSCDFLRLSCALCRSWLNPLMYYGRI